MAQVSFDDLLLVRKAADGMELEQLTMGGGESVVAPAETAEEWHRKAEALRELFRQTLGERPNIDGPLSLEINGEEDCGDYVKRTVSYLVEPDERINACALIPKGAAGKTPAVLTIHQTTTFGKEEVLGNNPEGQDLAYALHLVQRGFITFSYDLLSAGERQYEGYRSFDTDPFYEKHPDWSIRGKDLWDVGRAIDVLHTMDEVDPERIGSIGHSQGGGITIHAMALDSRIKAGVCNCGDWPMRLSKNPFNHARTGWWVGRPRLRPFCHAGKEFPVDMHEYLALIAPRAIMNISALNDNKYSEEERTITEPAFANLTENVAKVFGLVGAPENFRCITHFDGHSFPERQREAAYAFLEHKLS